MRQKNVGSEEVKTPDQANHQDYKDTSPGILPSLTHSFLSLAFSPYHKFLESPAQNNYRTYILERNLVVLGISYEPERLILSLNS